MLQARPHLAALPTPPAYVPVAASIPGDAVLDARLNAEALLLASRHLTQLQRADGAWEGEMVWNSMILSQVVILLRITGRLESLDERERAGIIRHFAVTRLGDGSGTWGMHPESAGYVFFTTLAYVALRLLGVAADDPLVAPARAWLRARPGGVLTIPSWGKYWLAFLDLYDYAGTHPCPPELFALPEWLPVHPNRYYCHTRQIYLGLSFLYGRRFRADLGPLRDELRAELYDAPYASLDFVGHRDAVAVTDLYVAPSQSLKSAFDGLAALEDKHSPRLRESALGRCFEKILFEQRSTNYQALSPVNGILDCLAIHAQGQKDGREHPDLGPSLAGLAAWRWSDEAEGVRYAGARSQTWDTAFALQALLANTDTAARSAGEIARGYQLLARTQIVEELAGGAAHGREPMRGGWCFSDGKHRWPVSDCTAEALCAIFEIHDHPRLAPRDQERIAAERLRWAIEFILRRQNADGGFGTYERRRGGAMLESANATEMYGSCMTERSYVECTASSVAALAMWLREDTGAPAASARAAERAIERGVAFLRKSQNRDGSFTGFWGVNYTYAIFHVVKGLRAAGVSVDDPLFFRAAVWLIDKQRADGGWGEHYSGCLTGRYVEHAESQAVMSAWAVLALVEILGPRAGAVERGVAFLRRRQLESGGWPAEAVNGVFFGSAMLDYRLYKDYFPTWALGRCLQLTNR